MRLTCSKNVTKVKREEFRSGFTFWAAICWFGKSAGVAWTASDIKVCFRHTKNVCVGTLFEDDGVVYRVVETRAASENGTVSYVDHFRHPDGTPADERQVFESTHDEVKEWHTASRAVLAQREDLQPPNGMQDTEKTLQIYEDDLYPTLRRFGINHIVEDNASPHNNAAIRQSHRTHGVNIVGYRATEEEKEEIKALIREQTAHYRRPQDRQAQMTKQTGELDRLPAWPPNSPDLNLIEVVWSWMVRWIRDSDDGWPTDPQELKTKVLEAWEAIPLESFRELLRSYRIRLQAIHSVDGDRHPQFA